MQDTLKQALDNVALSSEEYFLIVSRLGREPNEVELGVLGTLWSEHCAYKHSRPLLKLLPTTGKGVLTRTGEENAGAVDIGDGLCLIMKIESHNHPSAVEPFQGAATGVGGIVRDIFALGGRPIALLNSLYFGPLAESHNRYLFDGVVRGIASYGNCLGIPNVGGGVFFSSSYSDNPLINVMCVGIANAGSITRSRGKASDVLILAGSATGRDGIYGASGLASRTFESEAEMRSTVQVGDPFMEKILMEACLKLVELGLVSGIQDLGAGGISTALAESASRSECGVMIDISRMRKREESMSPYEVLLSESQERMLLLVPPRNEEKVKSVFQDFGIPASSVGFLTSDSKFRVKEGEKVVAEVPVELLVNPPTYELKTRKKIAPERIDFLPDISPPEVEEVFMRVLSSPNLASRKWVFTQYDHQVGVNTVVPPGSDASCLRIKGGDKAIALTCDGNGRYCHLDPYVGGMMAVAEACRNLACVGAKAIAATDCLNLGNPEREEIYYQLKSVIRGIGRACRVLDIPVVSGNVSLYNEMKGRAIYPTPVVGVVGVARIKSICTPHFKSEGDQVYLLGKEKEGIDGSEYLELRWGKVGGKVSIDMGTEKKLCRLLLLLIRRGIIKSAHDVSEGGLVCTLAECCILGGIGFEGKWDIQSRIDSYLFGESPSRAVVSLSPDKTFELERMAQTYNIPLKRLGEVKGNRFILPFIDLPLARLSSSWYGGLEKALSAS